MLTSQQQQTRVIKLDRYLFNPVYYPLLNSTARYMILYGGRHSAKSHFASQKCVTDTMNEKYSKIVLTRKVARTIKESMFDFIVELIKDWGLLSDFKIKVSPLEIECKFNGNRIITHGLDDPEKGKSLKDPTKIWYEEATDITYNEFITTSLSLRSSKPNVYLQEILSFNPVKENHWIEKEFFPDNKQEYEKTDGLFHYVPSKKKNAIILHTTYKDNIYNPDHINEAMEELVSNPNLYRVNTLGLWGNELEGKIFENFNVVDDFPSNADVYYGLDYGYTNPTALVKVGLYENRFYIQELYYKSNMTQPQIIQVFDAFFKNEIGNAPIITDSAQPDFIALLNKHGYNAIPAEKGSGSVVEGILYMTSKEINIIGGSSNLINEFSYYIWKQKRDGSYVDEPVKVYDHSIDASRYAINYAKKYWESPVTKDSISTHSIPRSGARGNLRKSKYR